MDNLTAGVGGISLVLGATCILMGVYLAYKHKDETVPTPPPVASLLGDQGAITEAINSTTEFAKALKDLDVSGRLLTVGVLLVAIAAIAAGLDSVADAITSTAT